MKKIPTIYERDWEGDRSRVLPRPVGECGWVFNGEGVATRKYDGTPCLIRAGMMFKRVSVAKGKPLPEGFEFVELQVGKEGKPDKEIGWVPVDDVARDDRWFRDAADFLPNGALDLADGTYELVGPKVNGNPELFEKHTLIAHGDAEVLNDVRLTFDGLSEVIATRQIEGIVWHHPDGRMAKIKGRDFGLKRGVVIV